MIVRLVAILGLLIAAPAFAHETTPAPEPQRVAPWLPDHLPVPGGVALVPVPTPAASLGDRSLLVVPSAGTSLAGRAPWIAVVGISLDTQPGPLTLTTDKGPVVLEVRPKNYREQRLTIRNKRKVNPHPEDLERIRKERKEMLAALASFRPERPALRLIRPTEGPFSSPFGLRRFFNDQPRAPHSGLDIAAPLGTPVIAPADAVVTAAGDYFFNGRNLILDHGGGLVTMYSHLDSIEVKVGERVTQGQRIGTVGASGRVTGPHLHWTVSLNNVRVDPMLFLAPQ